MSVRPGTRLGHYELVSSIGAGGMGEVYRARDSRLDRTVAVKILSEAHAVRFDMRERFQREAQAIARLNHPNICAVYDVGDADGIDYIVMEHVLGDTLATKISAGQERNGLAPADVVGYALQIARALSAAHAEGVVHRDIKPSNVLVTSSGAVKVLDFGLAKVAQGALPETRTTASGRFNTSAGIVMGTPDYMSPEQALSRDVDGRSDLFSLGVLCHEMLTGRPPFSGATPIEVADEILHKAPPPLSSGRRTIPEGLERVVQTLMEKDRAVRYQSADAVIADLERVRDGLRPRTAHPRARLNWGPIGIAAAALAGAVVVWFAWPAEADAPAAGRTPRASPFIVTDAMERQPAWSPSGALIAYTSDAAGNDDIWVTDPTGTNPINLTKDSAAADWAAVWSPDGTRLAFFSNRDGDTAIYSMSALGNDVRRLFTDQSRAQSDGLRWNRDGSFLHVRLSEKSELQVFKSPAGSHALTCVSCAFANELSWQQPRLSPSGSLLAMKTAEGGTQARVYVVRVGSNDPVLVADRADLPEWSADGRFLYYISDLEGARDLWRVGIAPSGERTTAPERLTTSLNVSWLSVSPAGDALLTGRDDSTSRLWTFPLNEHLTYPHDGQPLGDPNVLDDWPWAQRTRDGVLFSSTRRGSADIWSLAGASAEPRRLTSDPAPELRPRVSPDGAWLLFDRAQGRGQYLYVADRDGGSARIGDPAWPDQYDVVCCADFPAVGESAVLFAMRKDWNGLVLADFDARDGRLGQLRRLELGDGAPQYPRWSPDGRWIAYERRTNSWDIWLAKADGSAARRVTSVAGDERLAAWLPDQSVVVFRKDAGSGVWRQSVTADGQPSGDATPWLQVGQHVTIRRFDIDHAQKRLVAAVYTEVSDIWIVEILK